MVKTMAPQTVPASLKLLWRNKFFEKSRTFSDIKTALEETGCNPSPQSLQISLNRAKYLTQKGARGAYRYVQKHAPTDMNLSDGFLPNQLVKDLDKDFKVELEDLKLNFGRSGTCTAFLLRKILEKLIFIGFAKNGLEASLKDKDGDLVGLKAMLTTCVLQKVHGKPFLMPKTAREIEGVKFLGDTSAHNPLTNVRMETIIPVMPFIITAYEELATKL
jgi:hypothetical protein